MSPTKYVDIRLLVVANVCLKLMLDFDFRFYKVIMMKPKQALMVPPADAALHQPRIGPTGNRSDSWRVPSKKFWHAYW